MRKDSIKMGEEAMRVKMENMHTEVGVKRNELEVLQDEVSHCEYEKISLRQNLRTEKKRPMTQNRNAKKGSGV